jgi:DNA-binding phage protein
MIAGGIALSLALGAGALSVYAAGNTTPSASPSSTTSVQDKAPQEGTHQGKRGDWQQGRKAAGAGDIYKTAAGVLGLKEAELKTELKQGKSLADIAKTKGVSENTLIAKLSENASAKLDTAVKAGKLTQAKADEIKKQLAGKMKTAVEQKGLIGFGKEHKGGLKWNDKWAQVAKIIGITQADLQKELKAGKSITDVAQAHGISRDQLIAKLKDALTPNLENFVDQKRTDKQPAAQK